MIGSMFPEKLNWTEKHIPLTENKAWELIYQKTR